MTFVKGFPPQQLSFSRKNKKWRKECVDWAADKVRTNSDYIRKSLYHKTVNYDLLEGKLHMEDLEYVINPSGIKAQFIPDNIAHYPIMNSKLNVLRGEESKRVFDWRVIVTNPTSVSEIEEQKLNSLVSELQSLVSTDLPEDQYNAQLDKITDYYNYTYQDIREMRANAILKHYVKEYNMPAMFNKGIMDAMAVAEELYQCDIEGGEPIVRKLNPKTVEILSVGNSNKVEDADMIILDEYWNPGRIIDTYGENLPKNFYSYIESLQSGHNHTDEMDEYDERPGMRMIDDAVSLKEVTSLDTFVFADRNGNNAPFDDEGNIRVFRVYWKSRRKIQKVKHYDPQTGEVLYDFYPEDYIPNEALGEESTTFYINEAWEGTRIGEDIYVNMRPRILRYNRMSNPSLCHFGIIGTIYNINEEQAYSLVDMMKQYNYLYDVIHDRLNKVIARNKGKLVQIDFAKKPSKWSSDKWVYYMESLGYYVTDSFNEGLRGAATGKLAGALNNNTSGVIDAELGNVIQQYINLLEFIKLEMSEVAGITRQREGQISNSETVGGVERATLQSSHITEWIFVEHDDLKRRVLECFIETAKMAFKGRNKKVWYILSDGMRVLLNIEGDLFAESDYGLAVDNSNSTQEFAQKLDTYAQAALQNQLASFSTIFKLYSTASLAEKQRLVEKDERQIQERQQQQQQQQLETQQQIAQQQMQLEQAKLELQDTMNQRDNDTKLFIATINAETSNDGIKEPEYSQEAKDKLQESIREFDERLKFDEKKLSVETELKKKQIASRPKSTTK